MSRPETVRTPYGNIVNGGIIDFQDTPFVNSNFQQNPYVVMGNSPSSFHNFPLQSNFPVHTVVQPTFQGYANQAVMQGAQGLPNQSMPSGFANQSVIQPNNFSSQPIQPNGQGYQSGVQSVVQANNSQFQGNSQCFSGPPSFLHMNGQTYKPVEVTEAVSKTEPRNLESTIEGRVNEKVNEFMQRQERMRKKERGMDANMFKTELARLNEEMRRSSRSKKY